MRLTLFIYQGIDHADLCRACEPVLSCCAGTTQVVLGRYSGTYYVDDLSMEELRDFIGRLRKFNSYRGYKLEGWKGRIYIDTPRSYEPPARAYVRRAR